MPWLVWAFGGKMVDAKNNVVINSPETIAALEYAKQLYETFIPGTLSWLDPNNNKAFLDGQISLTNNGISIYYAAKTSTDPKLKEMADDIQHATVPAGPRRQVPRANLLFPMMIFKYTKYPKAAKEFLRFMMEREQYVPVAGRRRSATWPPARGLRVEPDLDRRPEEHAVPRLHEEHDAERLRGHAGLRVGRRAGRLHRRQHGRRGGVGLEDAEGSGGAGAEAGRTLLQGLISVASRSRPPRRLPASRMRDASAATRKVKTRVAHGCPPPTSTLSRALDNRDVLGLLFMLPAAALLLLFLTYPLGLGTYLGFTDAKIGRAGQWIGLENYEFLWGDAVTRLALFNTLFYTTVASVIKFVLGLWLALLLNKHLPFKASFRAVVLLPFIVPTALSAIAFWWIYDSQFSIISWALMRLGIIHEYIDFLGRALARALLDDRRQHLARRAVRRDHAARRTADDLAVLLRGGEPRRRVALAAVPLRDAAAPDADHRGRDDVLGAVHVHRLPADLRADARRTAQRDAPDGDAVVPARDSRRQPGRGRGDRDRDGAVPARGDPGSATSACSAARGSREGPTNERDNADAATSSTRRG